MKTVRRGMKITLVVFIVLLNVNAAYAQKVPFVRTYDAISKRNNFTNDWSEWLRLDVVVAFNYKNTSRVAIFYGKDKPIILTPINRVVKEKMNTWGKKYQEMKYIDNAGNETVLFLFENGSIILIEEDVAICLRPS